MQNTHIYIYINVRFWHERPLKALSRCGRLRIRAQCCAHVGIAPRPQASRCSPAARSASPCSASRLGYCPRSSRPKPRRHLRRASLPPAGPSLAKTAQPVSRCVRSGPAPPPAAEHRAPRPRPGGPRRQHAPRRGALPAAAAAAARSPGRRDATQPHVLATLAATGKKTRQQGPRSEKLLRLLPLPWPEKLRDPERKPGWRRTTLPPRPRPSPPATPAAPQPRGRPRPPPPASRSERGQMARGRPRRSTPWLCGAPRALPPGRPPPTPVSRAAGPALGRDSRCERPGRRGGSPPRARATMEMSWQAPPHPCTMPL
mmetsp:Transcript_17436/g.56447  ORF Transcript_17436/g.56447 Transcript_17436/m.56447 type:complete len:315 (+) Transcript_17436:41-985(+)